MDKQIQPKRRCNSAWVAISILAGFLLLNLASCRMKQDVFLGKSGNGNVVFEINLADYLTEVINQMKAFLDLEGSDLQENESPFDMQAIRTGFSERKDVELVRLEQPSKNALSGEIKFDNVETLLQETQNTPAGKRLVHFSTQKGVSEITLKLTRQTMDEFLKENPVLNNPAIMSFGPSASEGISENDYLEMMEFALGKDSRQGITESSVDILIRVEGRILGQKGGQLVNAKAVRYRIPLLKLLLLKEPLEYSLRYE